MPIIPQALQKLRPQKPQRKPTIEQTGIIKRYGSMENYQQTIQTNKINSELSSFQSSINYDNYAEQYNKLSPEAKALVESPQQFQQRPEYQEYQRQKTYQGNYDLAMRQIERELAGKKGNIASKTYHPEAYAIYLQILKENPNIRKGISNIQGAVQATPKGMSTQQYIQLVGGVPKSPLQQVTLVKGVTESDTAFKYRTQQYEKQFIKPEVVTRNELVKAQIQGDTKESKYLKTYEATLPNEQPGIQTGILNKLYGNLGKSKFLPNTIRTFFSDMSAGSQKADKEVYIQELGGFAKAEQVGAGAKQETIKIERQPTIEEQMKLGVGVGYVPPKQDQTFFLGDKEITLFERGRWEKIPGSTMGGTTAQFTTGMTKDIEVDLKRSLVRQGEEFIPMAGIPLTTLNEEMYLTTSDDWKKFSELIQSKKPGAARELTIFLRQKQADYKKDIGRLNYLRAMNTKTDEQEQLVRRINTGQQGTLKQFIVQAGIESEARGEKVAGIFKPTTATSALATGVFAYQLEKEVLPFTIGAGAVAGIASRSQKVARAIKAIKPIERTLRATIVPIGIVQMGSTGYTEYKETGSAKWATGAALGAGFGFFASMYQPQKFKFEKTTYRKPKVEQTLSLDRTKVVKLGTINGKDVYVSKAEIITKRFSPKTKKLINQLDTIVESYAFVDPNTGETIVVDAKSIARTSSNRAVKITPEKISATYDVTTAESRGTFGIIKGEGEEATKLITGVSRGTITEAGQVKVRVSKGEGLLQWTKRKIPKVYSSLSNIMVKPGGTTTTDKGTISSFLTSARSDVYRDVTRVKGYYRQVKGYPYEDVGIGIRKKTPTRVSAYPRVERGRLPKQKDLLMGRSLLFEPSTTGIDIGKAAPSELSDIQQAALARLRQPSVTTPTQVTQVLTEAQKQAAAVGATMQQQKDIANVVLSKASAKIKSIMRIQGKVPETRQVLIGLTSTRERVEELQQPTSSLISGTDLREGTEEVQDFGLTPIYDTGTRESTAEDLQQKSSLLIRQEQEPGLIQVPQQPITPIITPRTPTRTTIREDIRIPPIKPFGFGLPKKLKEDTSTPYDAQVYVDATKKRKARWVTVADNVPLITALSRGGRYTDENIPARFRVVKQKGVASKIIDATWTSLQSKFRSYSQKSGIRTGLNKEWIEKQRYRADSRGEVSSLKAGKEAAKNFTIFKRR